MVFAMMAELWLSVILVTMVFFQQYVEASTVLIATLPEDRCHAFRQHATSIVAISSTNMCHPQKA